MKSFFYFLLFIGILSFASIAQNTAEMQKLYTNNEFLLAIALSDSMLKEQAGSFEVWYYKGLAEQALCKYKDAVESLNKALPLATNNVTVLYALGICQESAGDDDKALQTYSELLDQDSTYVPAQIRMASIFKNQRDYPKAIERYSQLVKMDSTNSYFYSQLAYCCSKFGFTEPVIPYYLKAIELNPSDLRSINELINELVDKKQYEDAQYFCDSFLMIFPNNIKILKQQAYVSALEDNSLDAVRQFAYIVSLGDSSMYTCKNFGQSLFNNGQFPEAIYWLDIYLKNQPDDTKNQFIMGLACQKDYQYEKSIMHLNLALTQLFDRGLIAKVYEENGNTYSCYADYCGFRDSTKNQAEDLYKKAIENYLEAESINPDGIGIYKTMGRFYNDKRKDPKKALYYYEKYNQKLNSQSSNTYELEWLKNEIYRLKEDVHFIGTQ